MKLSLVIGRFQPVHLGHLSLINTAREHGEHTLVLIGSSKQLPDFKNPLSYQERLDLLEVLTEEGDDLEFRSLPDRPSDDEWIQDVIGHVLSLEENPTEVTLFCHPKDFKWYQENLLYQLQTVDNINISATQIRHAWYTDSLWTVEDKIPLMTKEKLEEHHDFDRLAIEYTTTTKAALEKEESHPFGNPIEPVSFAVVIQDGSILVGKRAGPRGNSQWGLPGGYLEKSETSLDGCIRETKEEMGIDLQHLITEGKAVCMAQAVEENLGDLGTRTIGINYLFVVKPDVELELTLDYSEVLDFHWFPIVDIVEDRELLFFNHNLIAKRLLSKVGEQK